MFILRSRYLFDDTTLHTVYSSVVPSTVAVLYTVLGFSSRRPYQSIAPRRLAAKLRHSSTHDWTTTPTLSSLTTALAAPAPPRLLVSLPLPLSPPAFLFYLPYYLFC
jgi:hypothetical protein